jgi:hypothetical protein
MVKKKKKKKASKQASKQASKHRDEIWNLLPNSAKQMNTG